MSIRTAIFTACALAAAPAALAGNPFIHCAKAPRVCSLPPYCYDTHHWSDPATAITFEALSVAPPPGAAIGDGRAKRFFSLRQSILAVDHCSIALVAVTFERNGDWMLNLTARQSPDDVPELIRPRFERFKRNHFCVTLRGYTSYTIAATPPTTELAQPQIVQICVPPFWMDSRTTRNLFFQGHSQPVAADFDVITRLEVDLQYE